MKKLYLIIVLLIGVAWQMAAQSPLCESYPTTFCCEYVSSVTINGVTRAGAPDATGFSSGPGYFDYTGELLTAMVAGNTYPVSVTVKTNSSYQEFVKIWFDFNGNGNLSDAGELVFDQVNTFNGTYVYSGNITVPTTAFNGEVYIRVVMVYANSPALCGTYSYGTTLDFKASISGGVSAQNITVATTASGGYNGNIVSSPSGINTGSSMTTANFATGSNVTLTATPNNGGSFINWSGDASGSTNPLTVTLNSDMNITANFGPSAPANPTSVTVGSSTICNGSSTSLTANGASGTVYWYSGSCGGTLVGTGNPINVSPATTTTYYARNYTTAFSPGCASATVTVDPVSVGGSITGTNAITYGSSTGTMTLGSYTGTILQWEKKLNSGSWSVISNTANTYSESPASAGTWYYRALVKSGVCSEAYSSEFAVTVNKADLTVTANDKSKVYGTAEPALDYTASGTLYFGDTYSVISGVSLSTATGAAANFGTHAITASSGTASNYNISYADGTLTVSKAELTVINAVAENKIYDTNTDAVISGAELSGVFYSDDVILDNSLTGTFAQAEVAQNIGVSTAMTISGTDAFNYTLAQPTYLSADITPGPLDHFSVSGISNPVMAGEATTLDVSAFDFYDNLKTDYTGTISITSDDPMAVLPADYTFTAGDNGTKSFTDGVTLKTTGTHFVKVTDGSVNNQQSGILLTPGNLDYFTVVTEHNDTETAASAFSVTVTAYDMYGNVKTDLNGDVAVIWTSTATASGNGTNPVKPANGNISFASGVSTVSGFTLYNANETPTITVTETAGSKTGTSSEILVNHLALQNFLVQAGTSQIAGVPFDATVTARDMYYNTVTDYAGSINFKSSADAVVSYPAGNQSFVGYSGVRHFANAITINPTGTYWLRAADAAIPIILGTQYGIVVNPAPFNAGTSSLTVDYNTRIAGEYVIATVIPRDEFGNLLGTGKDVSVMLDGSTSDFDGVIAVNDLGNGTYTATVRVVNTTAENIISATVNTEAVTQTQDITVLPAPVSTANTLITADPATITTDETSDITVQLKDIFDNNITVSSGTVTLFTTVGFLSEVTDNGDGTYSAVLSTNITGNAVITGELDGSAITDDETVVINEGAPSLLTSTISASPESITTDETSIITVQLKDQYGNNLTTSRGVITLETTLGVLTGVTDNMNGTYTAVLSANNTGTGIAAITGKLDEQAISDNAEVTITEGLPALDQISIVSNPETMTTDETSNITVQLKDQHGNLLTTSGGVITLATTLGVLSSVTDNMDGTYSAVLSANNTGIGIATITGQLDGSDIVDDAVVTITDGLPVLSLITISADPETMTTDETSNITVQLKDQHGNNITISSGIVTLFTDLGALTEVTDNGNGTYSAVLSANASGTGIATITGQLDGSDISDNASVIITEGMPDVTMITISADPSAITADETSTITVQLKDQHGNLLTTSGGIITLETSLGHLSAVTDNLNGTYNATLYPDFSGTGIANITGKLDGTDINDNENVSITFGVATHLAIATQPSSTAIAGEFFVQQPDIRVVDQYNNIVADDNTTIVTASSTGSSELTGNRDVTASGGIVAFSDLAYEIAEIITIDFTTDLLTGVTSGFINVSPAAADYFTITSPADIIAGGSRAAYTVTRYDEFDNLVFAGDQIVYLYSNSTGLNAKFYDAETLGSQVDQITITDGSTTADFWYYDEKTGDWTITVSDASPVSDGADGISDASDEITVLPAALNDFYVYGVENPHYYGEYQSVTVVARDLFQNVKTDYLGTITFQLTDPGALSPDDYTFVPSDMGVIEFVNEILFSEEGLFWVTVLDLDEPAYYGYQANIIVEKRPITVTANNRSKIYGDDITLGTTDFYVTGSFANGESITGVVLTSTGTAIDAAAGIHAIVPSDASGINGFLADNYDITYSEAGELSVEAADLSVTATELQSKVYGSADPVFAYTASGFKASDDISVFTGALERVAGEDVGAYALTLGTLSAGMNYNILFTSADFSITPATINVLADAGQSKIYGETDPVFTYTATGFGFADDMSVFSGQLSRVEGEDFGLYALTEGDLSAGDNYTISFTSEDFSITAKTLTVYATEGQSKEFGNADPVFAFTASGFEFADDISIITGALEREAGEAIGVYDLYQGTISAGANYSIDFVPATFSIGQRTLNFSNFLADDKVYDNNNSVTGTSFSDDRLEGDDLTFSYTAYFEDENAGINKNVYFTSIQLTGGADMDKYILASTTGTGHADITPRTLNLYGFAATSKTYDGTTSVEGTGFVDDRIVGDLLSFSKTVAFEDKNVGENKTVNYSAITISGGVDRYNYTLAENSGVAYASIFERTLTVNATAFDKDYDGNTSAIAELTDNRISGDDLTLAYTSASFDNELAGINKPVSVTGISITGGADMLNYVLAADNCLTNADINKKELLITANNVSKCYDGNVYSESFTVSYNGFITGEDYTVLGNSLTFNTEALTATESGDYPIIPSGYTSDNYDIVYQNGTLSINSVLTAGISGTTEACSGSENPEITFTGDLGIEPYTFYYTVNGGSIQEITTVSGNSVSVAQSTAVNGEFVYELSGVADANGCYRDQSGSATISVNEVISTPAGDPVQTFCDNATIADLVLNTGNLVWFDASTGGNIISPETELISGSNYYASQMVGGCESAGRFGVEAVINNSTSSSVDITACDNYEWFGTTYTESGQYFYTIENAAGCDSVITLNLTINNSTSSSVDITACDSYEWFGTTYTESGQYFHTEENAAGCDHVITLNLTINNSTSSSADITACDSYEWFGTTYTESGQYFHTEENAAGCDSVITLNLTINNSTSSSVDITACDSYEWFGTTYTESGQYFHTEENAAGCDHVITLNLTINNSTSSSVDITACDSYEWFGTTYTESGQYFYTEENAAGCDHVITLNLTINQSSSSSVDVTACNSYEWFGTTYTESGQYFYTTENAAGCDSVITLNLTINNSTSSSVDITACDSYEWFGTTYTDSGQYFYTTENVAGCDSIITLNLTINNSTSSSVDVTACDSYEWFGTTYTASGQYFYTEENAAGCDHVNTLNLTINNSTSSSVDITACDSYEWFGTTYTESGQYFYTAENVAGCDSLITLNLTINNSTSSSVDITACDSYEWFGTTYTESGQYFYTEENAAGCDHVNTLNLTINNSTSSSVDIAACNSYEWFGTTYTESGQYFYTTENVAGCDSIITLNLTIGNTTNSSVDITACNSYEWFGTTYTESGQYFHTEENPGGCDHVITLNLTINNSTSSSVDITACDSYEWFGTTYTESGEYFYTTENTAGCDSVITLNLTINNSTNSSVDITECDSYEWFGTTYTESGQYFYTTENAAGCDSVITLNLTLNESTQATIDTIACNSYTSPLGNVYTESQIIIETIPNSAGCDSIITINLTIDICEGITSLPVEMVKLYPNPATDILIIEGAENADIEMTDMLGKTVFYKKADDRITTIDVNDLIPAVYFVRINQNGITSTHKVVIK